MLTKEGNPPKRQLIMEETFIIVHKSNKKIEKTEHLLQFWLDEHIIH
jgi:hypothetical protein